MAKVSKSTPAAAAPTSRKTKKTTASSRTTKKAALAAADAVPSPPAKEAATPPSVIEIPASPTARTKKKNKNGERKRAAPLELDDDIEMWTPRQKRRMDEDCCILCADPLAADEAPAVVVPAAAAHDDVAVVAERGKVACRDYPHPRYACAKYPFASTPHESHCKQCFCYVCDIAAPCATWKGHARYGHCHASDKDNIWKTMRGVERRRQCKT